MKGLFKILKPIMRMLGFLLVKRGAFVFGMWIHSMANLLVNVIVAGYVTYTYALAAAVCILFVANFFKTIVLVILYDLFKTDIFGIEAAKADDFENKVIKKIKSIIRRLENRGKFATQTALILFDHFFGVIYIRSGHHQYNGIPKSDRRVFLAAMLVATLAQTIGWQMVETIFKFIKKLF